MKPINVIISAFGPYKNEVKIDFTKLGENGIFLITGDTGSGKTTIFDAISYALFGEVSGSNRPIQSIRSDFAEAEVATFVELEFVHKNKLYKIRRNPSYERLKKKGEGYTKTTADASLEYDDKVIAGIKNVDIKIEEILGINAKQFKQIAMLAQGEFLKILFAESKDRTEIFRKIFDTNVYNKITRRLGDKLKLSKEKLQESKSLFVANVANINWSDESLKFESSSLKDLNQVDVQNILENLEKELSLNKEMYSNIEKQVKEQEEKISKLDQEIKLQNEKNNKIFEYNNLLEKQKELKNREKDMVSLREKIEKSQKIIAKVAPKQEKVESISKEIELISKEIKLVKDKIELAKNQEKKADEASKKLQDLKNKLEIYEKLIEKDKELQVIIEKLKNIKENLVLKDASVKKYEHSQKIYKNISVEYLEKEDEFFREQAGILAEKLEDDKPCPVCGSLEHPKIAQKSETVLSKHELDGLKIKVEEAQKDTIKFQNKITEINSKLEALISELNMDNENDFNIENYGKEVIKKHTENKKEIKLSFENINNLYQDMMGRPIDLNVFEYDEFEAKIQNRVSQIKDELIKNNTLQTEKEKQLKEKKEAKVKSILEYKNAYKELGFDNESEYKEAVLSEEKIKMEQEKIDVYNTTVQVNNAKILELKEIVKDSKKVDLSEKNEQLVKEKSDLEAKRNIQIKQNSILNNNNNIYINLQKNAVTFEKNINEFVILDELYRTASGTIYGKRRIEFEQYVQATYFDMIIIEANKRLLKMTENRFVLIRKEESEKVSDKIGLELEVIDNYNGKKRDVKSLSGGEAFKAALSLALGLSDIIQSYSGGVVIDTLFIDEGFGSLDTESREQAINTLMQLTNNNKLIGIISHVTELKERLDKKIIITKTSDGSKIETQVI